MTIRILVIDDHPMVRAGVRSELENSGADLEIVGDASDVEGAIAACRALTPDAALLDVHLPGGNGVRVDTAAYDGFEISPYYDSMIAKIIVQGLNRTEAIAKMRTALEEMVVVGVNTNLDFQYAIMENETFRAGLADTGVIEQFLAGEV